jgi:hypothetical protein
MLPDAELLVNEIRALEERGLSDDERGFAKFLNKDEDLYLIEKLSELRATLAWRTARRSPPRCVQCGSISPKPLESLDSFVHPGCGGTFQSVAVWHASQGAYQILGAEGLPFRDERGSLDGPLRK